MGNHKPTSLVNSFALILFLCLCSGFIVYSGEGIRWSQRVHVYGRRTGKPTVSLAHFPLSFEANQGQTDRSVRFLSHGRGYGLFLTSGEAVLEIQETEVRSQKPGAARSGSTANGAQPRATESTLRMKLLNANPNADVIGMNELPGKVNYFIGKNPRNWRTNVPTYARVRCRNVYPGIDLVYYGNQGGELESDFVVAPGSDAGAITLDVRSAAIPARGGAQGAHSRIAANGDLVIPVGSGEIRFHKPAIYQSRMDNEQRTMVDGHFQLDAQNRVHFALGPYDHAHPLVIDPVLSYSTYLGGADGANYAYGIAADSEGNAYITGETFSAYFPTDNPLPSPYNALQATSSAFVTKLNSNGTGLVYSTYLGGDLPIGVSGATYGGFAIAADSDGSAYVAGFASGPSNFPTTSGAYQTACLENSVSGYCLTAFLSKLSPDGSSLIYSTYIGGNGGTLGDIPYGVAIDSSGNAYVTGSAYSADFPTTPGAYQQTQPYNPSFCTLPTGVSNSCLQSSNGCGNAFAVKINPQGSAAVYSTYLGGTCSNDRGNSIAIDSSGNAYIAGSTTPAGVIVSPGIPFPTTTGAFQTSPMGTACSGGLPCESAFVTKLASNGQTPVYSTLLGGSSTQSANGIAVDSSGNAYVTGTTASTNFPTASPLQGTLNGSQNAFVTKLNGAGSAQVFSTYLGGSGEDFGEGIALDSLGNTYITGYTTSTNFPTASGLQPALNANAVNNAFLSKLNAAGSALIYSSYLGGSISDYGLAIALDPKQNVYVSGYTNSLDFPVTTGAFQAQVAAKTCSTFPAGYIPFSQIISSVFGTFSSGISSGYLVVGYLSSQGASGLSSIPLPSAPSGQGFCNLAKLAPHVYYGAWIPTAAMRTGNFSSFSGQIINPATGTAYPNNILPSPASGSVFAWPVGASVTSSPDGFVTQISGLALPVTSAIPTALSFVGQGVGSSSTAQIVTLNNLGDAALTISGITTSGYFAQTNNCGSTVSAGSSCSISVTFTPLGPGANSGTLSIFDSAAGSPHTVALSGSGVVFSSGPVLPVLPTPPGTVEPGEPVTTGGTGSLAGVGPRRPVQSPMAAATPLPASTPITVAPAARFSSTSLVFAAQPVGASSGVQTVTLSNLSEAPMPISSITASGDFTETNDCGNSLDAGAHCTISVTFKPETAGTKFGTLTISDKNEPSGSTQTVNLSGTAARPATRPSDGAAPPPQS